MKQLASYIAVLLIVTSSGLGVILQRHYCQDQLKSSALWIKPKSCHEVDQRGTCPMHAAQTTPDDADHERNCCDTEVAYLNDDTDQIHVSAPVLRDLQHLAPVVYSPREIAVAAQYTIQPEYLNYKPPLILCDPPSELQTFLC